MKTLTTIVGMGLIIFASASLVLAICWLLSLLLVWLLGFTAFQSFALAMGSLAILTVFALVMATQSASEYPWFVPASDADDEIDSEAVIVERDDPEEDAGDWLKPCPCGSEKPFARCCGKRAFKKRRA